VEPSGSNLAFHSETWASGNNWTLDAVTRVTGSTSAFLAPDGTFTANALSPTSANVFHGLYSNSSTQNTYISGTIYTQSAFFKQGTGVAGRYVQLTYTGGGQFTQNGYANFDLQLGTVAVVSGTSADTNRAARIENYGNGWYRCSFTATCNAAGNGISVLPVLVNASGNTRAQSFAGVTGDILYGWGAQFETGSIATSYIPTTTAPITRGAETCTATIGPLNVGSLYISISDNDPQPGPGTHVFGPLAVLGASPLALYVSRSDNARNRLWTQASNVIYTTSNNNLRLAFTWDQTNVNVFENGAKVLTNFAYAITGVHTIRFGPTEVRNHITALAVYPSRLSDAQLQSLTQ